MTCFILCVVQVPTCQDDDECGDNNGGCSQTCFNTPGGHRQPVSLNLILALADLTPALSLELSQQSADRARAELIVLSCFTVANFKT